MSWHCSPVLEAAYLQATYWAGSQSVPLKATGTDAAFSLPGNAITACPPSPSGTTSEPLTGFRGEAVSMWFQEAFHARHIPKPLEAATRRTISGRKCGESWQRQLPGTYLQRTLIGTRSTQPQTISKRWASLPDVFPFPRETWVRTTYGRDIGCVHTPTTKANYCAPSMQKWPSCRAFVQAFGRPSPEVHEWLMGWPIGWSDTKPLATASFLLWRQQHGT